MDAQTTILVIAVLITATLTILSARVILLIRSKLRNPSLGFDVSAILSVGGMLTGTFALAFTLVQHTS